MKHPSNLNSELLSADTRGRKHIPFAVLAVILIHVILFLVLLIAAGCRAKARAKRNLQPSPGLVQEGNIQSPAGNAFQAVPEPVAAEPDIQPVATPRNAVERQPQPRPPVTAVRASVSERTYVVQPGDTVEKIARRHGTTIQAIKEQNNLKSDLIHPGQKLRVGSSKPQPSKNEV